MALAAVLVAGCGTRPALQTPEPATLAAVQRLSGGPCNGTVAATLDALGVPPASVQRITVSRRTSGSNDHEYLQSWDAWVFRDGQPGALVVRSSPECRLLTVYPAGGASLPAAAGA